MSYRGNKKMFSNSIKVVEIFRSIQGEGANIGKQATFIRLAQCNLNCWFCDTDWSKGKIMSVEDVYKKVEKLGCKFIVWTGGEPTLQLTEEIVMFFKKKGYYQAIETNGTKKPPYGLDYITCSPKVSVERLNKSFKDITIDEICYPYGVGEKEPPSIDILPNSKHYFVSPLFLGDEKKRFEYSPENVQACLNFLQKDTRWRLSLQTHKLINVR